MRGVGTPGPDVTLEDAQAEKYELVCRKLGLEPGMRLLDVGCGWGGMVLHAAANHGVRAVGVTLSRRQAEWAEKAVAEAGLADRVEIRYQDYRDVRDGPFDAISSIGMFEHVGLSQLRVYFGGLRRLLRPGGRLLNHGISRPPNAGRTRFRRNGFIDRYVFPDGELHEIGSVVSTIQRSGLEVRHLESLREHYALTLRAWVRNLESSWDDAVAEVGSGRARVWRLYMAASALNFEAGRTQVHQVLAVRLDGGRSGLPLRPRFEIHPPNADDPRLARSVQHVRLCSSTRNRSAGSTGIHDVSSGDQLRKAEGGPMRRALFTALVAGVVLIAPASLAGAAGAGASPARRSTSTRRCTGRSARRRICPARVRRPPASTRSTSSSRAAINVATAAPGDPGYNGGRWRVHVSRSRTTPPRWRRSTRTAAGTSTAEGVEAEVADGAATDIGIVKSFVCPVIKLWDPRAGAASEPRRACPSSVSAEHGYPR